MRWRSSHLPLLLILLSVLALVSGFKICAYNVNKFNNEKAKKFTVIHTLTRVVSHCDICLLQDVRDSDGEVLKALMTTLNRETNRYDEFDYGYVASQRLGKSEDDMQKYVFIYKRKMVNVTGQHQSKLTFTREPFVVMFQSSKTLIKDFVLVPLHSDPDQAIEEIDRLCDVFEEIHNMWNNTNVMFLGDFHASCAYVTRSDRKKIRLFTNSSFSWLIKDKMDTTVTDKTHCAYDRIVIHGEHFLKAIKPNTAQIFHFGQMMKISRSKVLDLSDHYPVEVQLKSSALLLQATPLLVLGVCTVVRSFLSAL